MDDLKDLKVMDNVDFTQKYTTGFDYDAENSGTLDLSELDIEVDIHNIDQYENQDYALLRKNGLGTSDSSIVLNVNPYTSKSELIAQKCRDYLTEEELAVGDKSPVRKGRELEPLIIYKHTQIMGRKVIKPIDMYKHKLYPYIKFNYDGVIDKLYNDDGTYQYIPDEIKVVTIYGEKHYKPKQAFFRESKGWGVIPPHFEEQTADIKSLAAMYGIPPYYYTQLQQQIFGLNAPYGFLTVLFERTWEIHSFFVWRDNRMINNLIIEATKTWNTIQQRRPDNFDLGVKILP